MARELHKLSANKVANLKEHGRHADGGGLYLKVDKSGRRWVFMYRLRDPGQTEGAGRLREMGLGPLHTVPLKLAREMATAARLAVREGRDPIEARKGRDEAEPVDRGPTFGAIAVDLMAKLAPSWRNAVHRRQWDTTLKVDAAGIWDKPVGEITTADVLAILTPIWQTKQETASRLRGRIERVLDAAKVQGHRSGENPAAWKGNLQLVLPARQKLSRGHHAAMDVADVPGFVAALRNREATAALCLEFVILTACRTGEAIGAKWDEIDTDAKVWRIPAARMKSARPHAIPLTARALTILDAVRLLKDEGNHVFPGERRNQPLSNMAMLALLKRMDVTTTVHGFRSSFRDWAGNHTSFPRELAEHALAHVIGDTTEQAYRRGDALERRRVMMEAWAQFLDAPTEGKVVPLHKVGA